MTELRYKGVPLPETLRVNLGTSEERWWRRGVDAALAVAVPVVGNLVDDEPCERDHHGYCQTHWGGATTECANAVGLEFLEAAGPEWVWRATIVVEPYLYWCPEHRPAVAVAKTVLADVHPSVTIECVQCGRRIRKGEG